MNRYLQLIPAPPNLVAERQERDDRMTLAPIVAIALDSNADVSLLMADVEGLVTELGFLDPKEVVIRERRRGEELWQQQEGDFQHA